MVSIGKPYPLLRDQDVATFSTHSAVGQNPWYHFGVGAPPILVYFSGDLDFHWGCGILTPMAIFPWIIRLAPLTSARGASRRLFAELRGSFGRAMLVWLGGGVVFRLLRREKWRLLNKPRSGVSGPNSPKTEPSF